MSDDKFPPAWLMGVMMGLIVIALYYACKSDMRLNQIEERMQKQEVSNVRR